MEVRRLLFTLRRWLLAIILAAAVAGGSAFLVSSHMTKRYRATATLIINVGQAVTGPTYSDVLTSQQLATTYANVATSRPVLASAANNMHLSAATVSARCPCVTSGKQMLLRVSASVPLNTELVQVSVESPSPSLAANGANTVAAAFTDAIRQSQIGDTDSAEQDLTKQISDAQAGITQTSARIQDLTNQPRQSGVGLPIDVTLQLTSQQSQLSQEQTAYAALVGQLEQIKLAQSKATNAVKIVEPAVVPATAFSPRTLLNTGIGVLFGLLAGSAFAFLVEYLDDRVRSPVDVERAANGATTLGSIERFAPGGSKLAGVDSRMILSAGDGTSRALEEYRILRTNLEFARAGRQLRTLVVTSAAEHEGKTTIATNLAIVLSQTAKRVLIVDADLRRPTLHEIFGLSNAVGFSTLFLEERLDARVLAQMTPFENLSVLTAGPLPPNPPELMASAKMRQLVELLAASFDLVLFDSPPLLAVADAAEIAAKVDGALLVVDSSETRPAALERAAEILARASGAVVGVVLNKQRRSRGRTDYHDDYYHNYSYGTGSSGNRRLSSRYAARDNLEKGSGVFAPRNGTITTQATICDEEGYGGKP